MDVFAQYQSRVAAALTHLYPDLAEDLLAKIVVEPPRDPAHGDLSTNAAMVVAKPLGKNPREVAAQLADAFKADPEVSATEVAGPGFLIFRMCLV
jgi:arginyl-tRNA synthetase